MVYAFAFQALTEKATGAFKSVGLLCFMMWMSGSQLHIFSMMSTMSGVFQPLSAILSSGTSGCLLEILSADVLSDLCVACNTLSQ